jgi:hypothetical protein
VNARQQYLFNNFMSQHKVLDGELMKKAQAALDFYVTKRFNINGVSDFDDFIKKKKESDDPKFSLYLKTANNGLAALEKKLEINEFYESMKDIFSLWLDNQVFKINLDGRFSYRSKNI